MTAEGGVYFRQREGVDAKKLIAKVCDGGKVTADDARTASGTELVGFAVHPPRGGFLAVVDGAHGALGIGRGAWSSVALAANQLGTDAIWYRAFAPELAIAVYFPHGGSWLRVYASNAEDIRERLVAVGVPVDAPPPARAGDDALLAAVAYEPGAYATGPDRAVVEILHGVAAAVSIGVGALLRERFDALPPAAVELALGIVRGADRGDWQTAVQTVARAALAAPPRLRTEVKAMTLDEEALRRAAEISEDPAERMRFLDHLDAIEADAEQRSSFAHPMGIATLAGELSRRGDHRGAVACYLRLVRRPAPAWYTVNQALFALLARGPGKLELDADALEIVRCCDARLAELGQSAVDAISYNFACVYARAGDPERALAYLRRCQDLKKQNPHPEQDTDLEPLWGRPELQALLGGNPTLEVSIDELELSVAGSEAIAELGVATIGELIQSPAAEQLPARVRAELRMLLADAYGIEWGDPVDVPPYVPPAEHAVPRQRIELRPAPEAGGALVDRIGGMPLAPPGFAWPSSPQRPMQLVLQLIGKAAGGGIDLGPIHVLQLFADMAGDYYDEGFHAVVLHREPCTEVVSPPATVEVLEARAISLHAGHDDGRLHDPDFEDSEAAHGHAWCDKIGGVPVGANVDPDQRDSNDEPMQLLAELVTYDDWFLWCLFASRDFSEVRAVIERG